MIKKNKKSKPIYVGDLDVGGFDSNISLKAIKDLIKKAGLKTKDAYLKIELDYGGCYYEGDSPSISVKVYGWK